MNIIVKPNTTSHGDNSAEKTIQWRSKSGAVMYIEDMTDTHLVNSINFVQKNLAFEGNVPDVYRCLKLEQNRREYPRGSTIEASMVNLKVIITNKLKSNNSSFIFNPH